MLDDSELTELVLTGKLFSEQPPCWQNMVNQLEQEHDHFNGHFVPIIREHLKKFHLQFVHNYYPEHSVVKGSQSNMLAWMLTYA